MIDQPDIPWHLEIDEDGFAEVPIGLHATVETSLQRDTAPNPGAYRLPSGFRLVQPEPVDLDAFKALFSDIGEPWLWFGRLLETDEDMQSILTDQNTTLRYLIDSFADPVGLFEAQQQGDDTLEVTYFGLRSNVMGKGLGGPFMEHGLAAAWHSGIKRIWLHTCTFDSPYALAFYRRQGFRPFKQRIEVATDPRLTGLLPRTAAPHIPLADFSDPEAST
ncbi:MAG: GNAT family N-acetyltransferase [Pseudomonadota bacterium]